MTVVAVCSVKGSPGATTFACMLAAAWPTVSPRGGGSSPEADDRTDDRAQPSADVPPPNPTVPVAVIEADPSGGDLAARFGLSSRTGWCSVSSTNRRTEGGGAGELARHLQHLPGGLPVLVSARGDDRRAADSPEGVSIRTGVSLCVVDLGRLAEQDEVSSSWLERADHVVVVVDGSAAAAVQVKDRAARLLGTGMGRSGLVVIGGPCSGAEVSEFTGIPLWGELPDDARAADVASGSSAAGHRLDRSSLWSGVIRIASAMAAVREESVDADHPAGPVQRSSWMAWLTDRWSRASRRPTAGRPTDPDDGLRGWTTSVPPSTTTPSSSRMPVATPPVGTRDGRGAATNVDGGRTGQSAGSRLQELDR